MANNAPLPVARTKISIGAVTADYTQAALSADTTYVQVKNVRSMPGFDDNYQDITVEEIDDARVRHAKGTASAEPMAIVCSRNSADPGQTKMRAAALSPLSYNFKMEIPNKAGTLDVVYFTMLVMGKPVGLGGPNDTQTITFNCMPQEAPIEVPAT
jgi:hypothetical protein